jgi:uncharacterized 2Fe-2S/4Fe-4S cluster protein (DUF4445 family)
LAGHKPDEGARAVARVFVEPIGVTLQVGADEDLLDPLVRAAVDIPTDCAGRGTCGKCLVRLGAGELTPPTERELKRVPEKLRADGWRLACQARPVSARVSIEVRATGGRRRILTASKLQHGAAHPAVRTQSVTMDVPTMEDKRSDVARFTAALSAGGVKAGAADVPLPVLQRLPQTLRDGRWRAVAVRYGRRVVDVFPGEAAPDLFGAAVDIGTSKVIAYLFDLGRGRLIDQEAVENPQMRYGEDVISRIAYAVKPDRQQELQRAVVEGVNLTLGALCERQGIEPRQICDMTVVGNTAMHHLALGLSPVGLGAAPFAPGTAHPVALRASELGVAINPEAGVYFPPPIAGFVGSDALAVVAATHLARKKRPSMAIDIGTNTEIALAHEGRVTVTSCASGPAFEGYQIQHGMKAVAGAIERVRITPDGEPVDIQTIAGEPAVGICGSGVVDLLAGLVRAGVVDPTGRLVDHHPRVRLGDEGREYLLTEGEQGEIVFTQHDVRALQLAKGAIHSGWELLLDSLAVQLEELAAVYVAGAFGNYLDLQAAQFLGLFPPVPTQHVAFVGNAAGVGAQMALIHAGARRRMAHLRRRIEFLDLATDKRFLDVFAGRLGFAGA